jgi:hypothetical protein
MRYKSALLACFALLSASSAATIAVFPVQGVNTDKSFADAFALLLASKYETISGQTVISPPKAAKAIGADSNLAASAQTLGADEYLEISAIGLYISRKEKRDFDTTAGGQRIQITVNTKGDDNDEEDNSDNSEKDQAMLDNSKTVVTVVRRAKDGSQIFRSELTLLTYGDIEEGTMRFAASLFKKVPINDTRSIDNITRKEGMGRNKLFVNKIKGIRIGMTYVADKDSAISPFLTIAFNYKLDADIFFLELGAGGRIPSELAESGKRKYGGFSMEVGGNYYLINNVLSVYAGGGVNPFMDFLNGLIMQMGVAPYVQVGLIVPRNSRICFYSELRVAQNIMPITTGQAADTSSFSYSLTAYPPECRSYPTEIGVNFGIGF